MMVTAVLRGKVRWPWNWSSPTSWREGALSAVSALAAKTLPPLTVSKDVVNKVVQAAKTKDIKETIAKENGICQLLRLSPRQVGCSPSPGTLRNAVNALLGAVFEDSGLNLEAVKDVVLRLG